MKKTEARVLSRAKMAGEVIQREGRSAWDAGAPVEANPYVPDDWRYQEWRAGWSDANMDAVRAASKEG